MNGGADELQKSGLVHMFLHVGDGLIFRMAPVDGTCYVSQEAARCDKTLSRIFNMR